MPWIVELEFKVTENETMSHLQRRSLISSPAKEMCGKLASLQIYDALHQQMCNLVL